VLQETHATIESSVTKRKRPHNYMTTAIHNEDYRFEPNREQPKLMTRRRLQREAHDRSKSTENRTVYKTQETIESSASKRMRPRNSTSIAIHDVKTRFEPNRKHQRREVERRRAEQNRKNYKHTPGVRTPETERSPNKSAISTTPFLTLTFSRNQLVASNRGTL
jgi:hypothetical protein